jgi:hypothetical protein
VRKIDRPAPRLNALGRFERVFLFTETAVLVLAGETLDHTHKDNAYSQ